MGSVNSLIYWSVGWGSVSSLIYWSVGWGSVNIASFIDPNPTISERVRKTRVFDDTTDIGTNCTRDYPPVSFRNQASLRGHYVQ